ncbi:MAG: (Na+)-NQR maturation NqrM [Nitrospirota bacterium]|nr:(Na+)-NQR maturation NqrM [Nitrospirota bacterium]
MAVGVLFGKKSLRGSCGGLKTLMGLGLNCQDCEEPCESHDSSSSLCPLNSPRSLQACEHPVLRSKN